MRLDLSPLSRSAIGFDKLARVFDTVSRFDQGSSFPPYNIEKIGDDQYSITMAVAGYRLDELSITLENRLLVVAGAKQETEAKVYLHQGIAGRSFERRFALAEHVKVVQARLENGLLMIDLAMEIPQSMKPRSIEIQTAAPPKVAKAA